MQVGHGQAASTGVAAGQDRGGGAPVRLDESRAALLLAAQRDVLQGIVGGAPLSEVLASLLGIVEAISPDGVIGSVLLLDADGVHLRHGAAPSLAPAYVAAIDGIAIGPGVGSCGTAAYRREQVIVEDIAVDPLWDDFREAALAADLRACWSTPIMAGGDRVLGTFAMYYPAPRRPSPSDLALIDVLVRTVAVAIERRRGDEERDEALAAERAARAEAERTREELRFLLDVTTRIAGGSDYETGLEQLAELAVPVLGDLCMIDILDGGTLRRAATAHHLPRHAHTAASLTRYASVLPAAHPTSTALAAGAAQCVSGVTEHHLRAFAVDDEHLRLLTSLGIESTIAVPLIAHGDVFGVLTLHSAGSGRRFGERDVALAQDLARRAALAITNVRLYQAARDAEQRLSVSARAGAALTSSLDVDEIVERLGPILVPEVANVCEIHVVRVDRRIARRTFGPDG
ncbi:MAG TPA: GAF domain-containing protein, partial [Solirubrobacteraceae bacterium]|nr:GAF domain-containing protein [Solirubrobacteraceae bacterium]